MATTTSPTTQSLSDVVRRQAVAEAHTIQTMLDYRDAEVARTALIESALRRKIEQSAIALTIGEATGMSEAQIQLRLSIADRIREKTPQVWDAFVDGLIDFSRVRDISAAIEKLRRPESVARLDKRVIGYAIDHTGAELRQWLRRFVQRVEADLAVERADAARTDRHVTVAHGDDSMAWLNAYLPSHEAATIEARLRKEARTPAAADDDRTVAQREADLLVAWCTDSHAATSAVDANIAVTVAADVLAGAAPGFAESTDGRWAVPASWLADVIATGSTFWHRIIVDPSATTSWPTNTSEDSPPTPWPSPCSSSTASAKRPAAWSRPSAATSTTGHRTRSGPPPATTWDLCADDITRSRAMASCTGPPAHRARRPSRSSSRSTHRCPPS